MDKKKLSLYVNIANVHSNYWQPDEEYENVNLHYGGDDDGPGDKDEWGITKLYIL
jgi:hypothetical protein